MISCSVAVLVDIDECAQWAGNRCPQLCVNVKGSYKCRCHAGFVHVGSSSIANCKAAGDVTILDFLRFAHYMHSTNAA